MRLRLSNICKKVFAIGVVLMLSFALFVALLYIVGLFTGGKTASIINNTVYHVIYPVIFTSGSILMVIGILALYLKGEKRFTFDDGKNE